MPRARESRVGIQQVDSKQHSAQGLLHTQPAWTSSGSNSACLFAVLGATRRGHPLAATSRDGSGGRISRVFDPHLRDGLRVFGRAACQHSRPCTMRSAEAM